MSDLPQGYLALPNATEPRPAVLVIHAWWGLNNFFKELCDRLAQSGFVAFAPDLYEGRVAQTIEQAEAYSSNADHAQAQLRSLLRESIEALRHHPRVVDQPLGVIGVSFGVYYGLTLLQDIPAQVRAMVLFYGTGGGTYQESQAAVLGHFAETDEFESKSNQMELETALRRAGMSVTFYEYPGTQHWFFEANQPSAYQAEAAGLAWERTLSFLKQNLQPSH